ncbi:MULTISPECIES: AglZ/HisF2 family acetamidino modification protein [unclassified Clostridium]|uniref:AglZ/HisF2 family acetamidino modification protein n=1 Tax=unclassified Clostridium TaxID=2614128 RepID=UPI00029785B1|nr:MULTISPECIES: AglZ/HisF2 family acetamidino modification protein [unclassified Clostridium]EKQ51110.1 MAG: glycosyl amidation-associated protein WbuZ [Clostridium sp. Maddingley MBC34-26]
MYYNRLIPCLLLKNNGLVKTTKFKNETYIGDPINAVKIFNDKEVDELIFLDIEATRKGRKPNFEYLRKIAEQCFMPLCYGGGIKTIEDIKELFKIGFEKVAINSAVFNDSSLIKKASEIFGSQSIIVSMDVKKNIFGKYFVRTLNGSKNTKINPIEYAKMAEQNGAGEIFLNSIDNDGMMNGYDLELTKMVSESVKIPVIACGGAGKLEDFNKVITRGKASAAAAGSLFVFYGINKAVLINYPNQEDLNKIFKESLG